MTPEDLTGLPTHATVLVHGSDALMGRHLVKLGESLSMYGHVSMDADGTMRLVATLKSITHDWTLLGPSPWALRTAGVDFDPEDPESWGTHAPLMTALLLEQWYAEVVDYVGEYPETSVDEPKFARIYEDSAASRGRATRWPSTSLARSRRGTCVRDSGRIAARARETSLAVQSTRAT